VPLLRDLKSGFGNFFPSSELHRKLGLALAFAAFGLVASASSVVLLTADDESDPRNAFARAHLPAPAVQAAQTMAAGNMPAAHTVLASKADMASVALAVTDPPAKAETPVSNDIPTVAAPPSVALVAGAPARDESSSESKYGAAAPLAAEALPPASAAAMPQKTSRHAGRRAPQYQQMSLGPFEIRLPRAGYARQRSFFW
jgi:hypothetical protein